MMPTPMQRRPARTIATNGVELGLHVLGSGPAVVFAHGFPELAYSWRHQVEPLAQAGFRVIVPDMRGYGASSRPKDPAAYHVGELGADLLGLLDVLDESEAVFVGHDWGAPVVWHLAAAHPDRVRGVVGLSVPYSPPAPAPPLSILRRRMGEDFYMVRFQQQGPPEERLSRDVRRTMVATFAHADSDLMQAPRDAALPDWISQDEFDVYVETFGTTGFEGGLNYYRNLDRNWELARELGLGRIAPPALFVTGSRDLVRTFMPAHNLEEHVDDLRGHVVIEGAGHWIQQERPAEVNDLLLSFLAGLEPTS